MKIYRFEFANGSGMYRSPLVVDSKGALDIIDHDDYIHPMPLEDSILCDNLRSKRPEGYDSWMRMHQVNWDNEFIWERHFGFVSVEQARDWVSEDSWLIELHKIGVWFAIYDDVDDVVEGRTQALFLRDDKKPKTQYNILEYFNLKECDDGTGNGESPKT